jgi:hypothetical protein
MWVSGYWHRMGPRYHWRAGYWKPPAHHGWHRSGGYRSFDVGGRRGFDVKVNVRGHDARGRRGYRGR